MSSLDYWAEGITSDDRFWFLIPSLGANETKQFALSKKSGYSPSIDDVMNFGDDFSGSSLDSSKWDKTTLTSITVSDGQVTIPGYNDVSNHPTIDGKTTFGKNYIYEFKVKTTVKFMIGFSNQTGASVHHSAGDGGSLYGYNGNQIYYAINVNDGSYSYSAPPLMSLDITNWHRYKIVRDPADVHYFVDGTEEVYISGRVADANCHPYISAYYTSGTVYCDWCFVRKYASTEPTVTVEDKGTFYLITVTEQSGNALSYFQVSIDPTDINLSSVDDSIEIIEGVPKYVATMGINIIR